jgi:hypothetical protein
MLEVYLEELERLSLGEPFLPRGGGVHRSQRAESRVHGRETEGRSKRVRRLHAVAVTSLGAREQVCWSVGQGDGRV